MNGFKNPMMIGNLFASLALAASLIHGQSSTTLARPSATSNPAVASQSSLTLPFAGSTSTSGTAFSVYNTGTGTGIVGRAASKRGVYGLSNTGPEGVYGQSNGVGAAGVRGYANNGAGSAGVYGRSTVGMGVGGASSSNAGVAGSSSTGDGVSGYSASGRAGVYGKADGSSRSGVQGDANGANAAGVFGLNPSGPGIWGRSSTGHAVYGETTNGLGVLGKSVTWDGVHGYSRDRAGVAGHSTNFDGVFGWTDSSSAAGVSAHNNAGGYGLWANSSTGYGVYSTNGGSNTSAVYGRSDGSNGTGIIGEANNGAFAYGIWGKSTSGFAGVFSGNVKVLGNLSKGGGSFKIDHPLDPANKYLSHSFVESPDMMNIYNGNVKLDARGEAVVQMPKWFEALNMEFRYQLTTIGGFAPVYVAEKMRDNHFKIAGGKAGIEVSWQVTGIRHDAFANANRIPVEEVKPADERGTFLYPEAEGKPESMGLEFQREQAMKAQAAQRPAPQGAVAPAAPTR